MVNVRIDDLLLLWILGAQFVNERPTAYHATRKNRNQQSDGM
jgi:hypothetical protein